jgi:hypothetical protein
MAPNETLPNSRAILDDPSLFYKINELGLDQYKMNDPNWIPIEIDLSTEYVEDQGEITVENLNPGITKETTNNIRVVDNSPSNHREPSDTVV